MGCRSEAEAVEARDFASRVARPPEVVRAMVEAVHGEVLRTSRCVSSANFTRIAHADLWLLFDQYDARFFEGRLRRLVERQAQGRLVLRFSNRLTSSGGRTTTTRARACPQCGGAEAASCEIAISSALLFQTFRGEQRPIVVNGLRCVDRLSAMQRIFEHELIHLLEMLAWGDSSCSAPRFLELARRIFGHTDVSHGLVTAAERTVTDFDIRPGDRVAFTCEGVRHVGVVNRIQRRATVLVESPEGTPYSDGRRYRKYYVPPSMLEVEEARAELVFTGVGAGG